MKITKRIHQFAHTIAGAVLFAGASPANADGVTWTYDSKGKILRCLRNGETDWEWGITQTSGTVVFGSLNTQGSAEIDFTKISDAFGKTTIVKLKGTKSTCLLPGVTSVILPDTLTEISSYVFYGDDATELSITATGALTLNSFLAEDSSIKTLTVTAQSVPEVGIRVFNKMTNLTDIYWNTPAPTTVPEGDTASSFRNLTKRQVVNHVVNADYISSWSKVPGLVGTFDETVTTPDENVLWKGTTAEDETYAQYLIYDATPPPPPSPPPPPPPTEDVTWTYDSKAGVLWNSLDKGETTNWAWSVSYSSGSLTFRSVLKQGGATIDFSSSAFAEALPNATTFKGKAAITNFPGVTSITFPKNLKVFGDYLLNCAEEIGDVAIDVEGDLTLGTRCFDASGVTNLVLTAAGNLTSGDPGLYGMTQLKTLTVNAKRLDLSGADKFFGKDEALRDIWWNCPAPTGLPDGTSATSTLFTLIEPKTVVNHVGDEYFDSWQSALGLKGALTKNVTWKTDNVLWTGCNDSGAPYAAYYEQYIIYGPGVPPKKKGLVIFFGQ